MADLYVKTDWVQGAAIIVAVIILGIGAVIWAYAEIDEKVFSTHY